ncbi:MAG: methylated-DNA--[protein]-cysteine S-methyltransferase [Alphaproteobacteria bacterium]
MHYYFHYQTPAGQMTVAENGRAITTVSFGQPNILDGILKETPLLKRAGAELAQYFDGTRYEFDLPFEFEIGTPFEQSVWQALFQIPYGQTRSYGDIARSIGRPKAVRAVGRANGKNPIAVCYPCHRVIGSNGSLVGYTGGLDKKKHLLDLEQNHHLLK